MRPTADKVRAAIFNVLEARYGIAGERLLDLFAGTGALGIDALSRGAATVVFVDESAASCAAIRENLARSGFAGGRAEIVRAPVPRALRRLVGREPFGGVFLDPPYGRALGPPALETLGAAPFVAEGAWVVAEHAKADTLAETYGSLRRQDLRLYGTTAVSIYLRAQ